MKKNWTKPEIVILNRADSNDNINMAEFDGCKATQPKNQPDRAAAQYCQFDHGSRAEQPCYNTVVS